MEPGSLVAGVSRVRVTGSSGGSLQEESVAVVTLQGSVYGGRYYLNVGVWLKARWQ